jgi:transposase InsO family protein
MDFATRYLEAVPLKRTDSANVAAALCHVFVRLGLPQEVLSDQGSNFTSKLMEKVAELLQITQMKTSPYHPQTNGMIERMHGTLKNLLRKTSINRKEWDDYLPFVCLALRDMENSATGYSPLFPIPTPLWKRPTLPTSPTVYRKIRRRETSDRVCGIIEGETA